MIRSNTLSVCLFGVVAGAAVLGSAGRTAAQDEATIDQLVQLNKKALDDYDTLEWDAAKQTLLDALRAGKKAGLHNHPVMARTYVHLGAVYITGFKDRERAIASFARAFEIDPAIQLSKGIQTSEVKRLFAEARLNAADDGSEPDPLIPIEALECPEPDEAILGKPVLLRCAVSPKLSVSSVVLHHRAPGKDKYEDVEMKKSPKGWYLGKIPKKAVVGKSLQYYFDGRNDAGKPVVVNGDMNAPNILVIVEEGQRGKSGSGGGGGDDDDENPLDRDGRPKPPKVILGPRNRDIEGFDPRYGKRKLWIGLGAGSGFGYAKGDGLEAVNMSQDPAFHGLQSVFQPGGAWAGLAHFAPELGYQITPDLSVSLEGRLQFIPQPAAYTRYGARGALSGLAKVSFYTKQSRLRFFGSAMAGGGEGVRFIVHPAEGATLSNGQPVPYQDFKDTIHGGPFLAGLGGGLYYEMSHGASFVTEVHVLSSMPSYSTFGDLNLAIQINLY